MVIILMVRYIRGSLAGRNRNVKILVDNISPGTSTSAKAQGGMRLYLENLLSAMIEVAPHHDFTLVTPEWNRDFNIRHSDRLTIETRPSVPREQIQRVFYEQTTYSSFINRSGAHVFLGLCNSLPLMIKIPSVVVVQSTQYQFLPETYGFLRRNYLRFVAKRALRKADRVITVSNHSKQDVVAWAKIRKEKVHAVPHGAGLQAQCVVNPSVLHRPYILCVSSFYPYKNHFRLLDAFHRLKSTLPLAHNLVVIGADTAELTKAQLASYAETLGIADSLKFVGRVPHEEIASYYAGADVLAMPSLYETFGHPILEAMALGCPVVTSDLSSMPEVAGDAAELVDPRDPAAIAAALQRVLTQPAWRDELVRRGRERVKEFSWKAAAEKTIKALEEASCRPC